MMVLLVQAFLLLLGAFLLGASLACLLRRAFAGREEAPQLVAASPGLTAAAVPAPWVGDVSALKTDRFGRALMGAGRVVPPVVHEAYSGPVVEVQEPPAVEIAERRPQEEPVPPPAADQEAAVVPPAPASVAPRPAFQVVRTAPPAPVVESRPLPPAPAEPRPVAPEPVPAKPQSAEPAAADTGRKSAAERSYAEIAVAAAAATLASAPAGPRPAAPSPMPAEPVAPATGAAAESEAEAARSYAEIAVAAAAAAAKATADREAAEKAKAEAAREAVEALAPAPKTVGSVPLVAPPAAEPSTVPGERVPIGPSSLAYPDRPGSAAAERPLDDLCRIRAIDSELKARLHRYGIDTFAQIAAWTPEDARAAGEVLAIGAQISDENWIEQARILADGGDVTPLRPRERAVEEIAVPVDAERLHRIIGIDPNTEAQLNATGIMRLGQIARWSDADVTTYEGLLGLEAGRISDEGWVEQARFLTRALREDREAVPLTDEPEDVMEDAEISRQPAVEEDEIEAVAEPAGAPGSEDEESDEARTGARDGLTGLRSVRSEALRGTSIPPGAVDDLKRIRGIGVLIEKKLNSLGITAYEQVANWTDADIDRISQLLDFGGRIERENWIEQARILASGGQTEFSRRVDRGEA